MTNINPTPVKTPPTSSINDNLPTTNPPLKFVLAIFGCIVLFALALIFRGPLGL